MPRTTATRAAASQGLVPALMDPANRVMIARSDWLPAQPVNPVLLPSEKTSPCSHHLDESPGRIANPMRTVARKPATVMAASLNRFVSSRYGTKISGTSLIPAATPVTAPAHQRRFPFAVNSTWVRSQMIAAIRIRLTWPR